MNDNEDMPLDDEEETGLGEVRADDSIDPLDDEETKDAIITDIEAGDETPAEEIEVDVPEEVPVEEVSSPPAPAKSATEVIETVSKKIREQATLEFNKKLKKSAQSIRDAIREFANLQLDEMPREEIEAIAKYAIIQKSSPQQVADQCPKLWARIVEGIVDEWATRER